MSKISLPIIDGHFWVVRDGKIVDWDFPEYDCVRSVWKCGKERNYLPAPEMTQKVMVAMYQKAFRGAAGNGKLWEDIVTEYYALSVSMGMAKPMYGHCFHNCLLEIHQRGGNLVFGSMGFRKRDGSYHYEFGGENYRTISDFKSKR